MSTIKKATKTIIVKSHTISNRTSDERKGRANRKPSSLDGLEGLGSDAISSSLRGLPSTYRPQLSPLDVSEFGQVTSLSYGEQDVSDAYSEWNQPVHPSPITLWRNDVEMAVPDDVVEEVPLSPARHIISLPFPSSPSVTSFTSMRAQYHASPQPSIGLPDDGEYTSYEADTSFLSANLPQNRRNKLAVEIPRPVSFIRFPCTYSQDSTPNLSAIPAGHPSPATKIISSTSSASSYSCCSESVSPASSSSSSSSSSPPPPKFDQVVYDSMVATIRNFASRARNNDPGLWEEAVIIANRVKRVKFEDKDAYERSLAHLVLELKGAEAIDIETFISGV
ncbi:hypothetical protein PLEOSDRAFT_164079 [Pleurotus ostreatus PC15]|uniref:Uncharacterized protein n=1 Tax=Pleurotus ostreatus (strain PC15) TaxID=1137138 RepID=A0A067P405_PLEO1|nr:hypothetical protein PLEOSDRAFT_164079 [Pleurotus ostreatus PC15]